MARKPALDTQRHALEPGAWGPRRAAGVAILAGLWWTNNEGCLGEVPRHITSAQGYGARCETGRWVMFYFLARANATWGTETLRAGRCGTVAGRLAEAGEKDIGHGLDDI